MSDPLHTAPRLPVAALSHRRPTSFELVPDTAMETRIAAALDLLKLRKARFRGVVKGEGTRDWRLEGRLEATVTQPCVATLAPVVTRIETDVVRRYLADYADPTETEAEMPEDDTAEPIPTEIALETVLTEALSLALPIYPRAGDAEPVELRVTEPGQTAMTDAEAHPFAALAALKGKDADEEP